MKKFFLIITIGLFITSCAVHSGSMSSSTLPANAQYEDVAVGVSQTSYILGIGGLSQDALVYGAKRNLYECRPLKANESYINFTVDKKDSYFPFYKKSVVTVTADVISYKENPIDNPFAENYLKKIAGNSLSTDLFAVGDTVLNTSMQKMVVLSVESKDVVKVMYKTTKNKIRTRNVTTSSIYSRKGSINNLKVGDPYVFNENNKADSEDQVGIIMGLGINNLMIKKNTGSIYVEKYRR